MNIRRIGDSEYAALFNERSFNPPGEQNEENEKRFCEEFRQVLEAVEAFCTAEFRVVPAGEDCAFSVWQYYNWSRVIDVEMMDESFLNKDTIMKLQAVLGSLPEAWTVILSLGDALFVSPTEVMVHLSSVNIERSVDIRWILALPEPITK